MTLRSCFVLALPVLLLAPGCAYPRRSTSLSPVADPRSTIDPPGDLWSLHIVSAEVPPRQRSGLAWDDDGPPDAFVRIYRADQFVWESPTAENSLTPRFDATPPRNVTMPRDRELRFELWDRDGVSVDTIGRVVRQGTPADAVTGSDLMLRLDGGATLTIRLDRPQAHRGVGIATYEFRGDLLHLEEVHEFSPAGRAGLHAGDSITSIGGQTVEALGEARAASALSLASDRSSALEVVGADGQHRTVELDRGYTWLSM